MSDSEESASDTEAQFAVDNTFDGNLSSLARERISAANVVPPRVVHCTAGKRLFVAVWEEEVLGGRRWRGRVQPETLCILLLDNDECDMFPAAKYDRDHEVPARLFWLSSTGLVRRAKLRRRGDEMKSLTFTAYRADGVRVEPLLHRVLGFTFCCNPRVWAQVYTRRLGADVLVSAESAKFDVHHRDENHGHNRLANLEVLPARGKGGHRSLSAAAAAKRRRTV